MKRFTVETLDSGKTFIYDQYRERNVLGAFDGDMVNALAQLANYLTEDAEDQRQREADFRAEIAYRMNR